ncbi:hypothetical protein DEQ92_20800 [Haloferax sp. Atlit-6N]|uniref:hypothetical protein n=1 Tax=Haloferacaceae TaxID=1644056 RepID=UPI000E21D670|nr:MULTISPECIES: hypothetical protein [Haloferacaceae]RDZ99788.1 hypothetical protein DEQ92_20800 [Haloferax sp. Atlit-6N]RLM83701.1 hypothetical protein D3D02_17005 [Halobellus sp. Atlit-38R]
MLLETTALLVAIGLATWTLGEFFSYTGLGVIGGAMVLVAGSAIALTGLQVRSGVEREFAYQIVNNETVVANSTADATVRTTDVGAALGATVIGSLGIGGLLMLLGGVLISQSLFDDGVFA